MSPHLGRVGLQAGRGWRHEERKDMTSHRLSALTADGRRDPEDRTADEGHSLGEPLAELPVR